MGLSLFARKGKTVAITPLGTQKAESFDGSGNMRTVVLVRLKEDSPTTARDLAKRAQMDTVVVESVIDDLVKAGYAYYVTASKVSN